MRKQKLFLGNLILENNGFKAQTVCFLLILTFAFLPLDDSAARQSKQKPNWQASQSVSGVRLGIRDKDGVIEPYQALFIVTDNNGKEFKASKRVEKYMMGYVQFPNDFGGYASSGSYMWKCLVNDEIIVEGKFDYAHSSVSVDDEALKFLPDNQK